MCPGYCNRGHMLKWERMKPNSKKVKIFGRNLLESVCETGLTLCIINNDFYQRFAKLRKGFNTCLAWVAFDIKMQQIMKFQKLPQFRAQVHWWCAVWENGGELIRVSSCFFMNKPRGLEGSFMWLVRICCSLRTVGDSLSLSLSLSLPVSVL